METVWFCLLLFMLGGYVVLGGTDLGVGMLAMLVGRDEAERWQVIRTIRPVWKPNEVWLVAAGGTMFLAFPTALAVSFSGFYLALTVVVWLLAFRGLGLELRYQVPDLLWRQFWDAALSVSSLLLALFLGTALGNVVRGVPLDGKQVFFEPLWTNLRVGTETGIIDWYTLTAGITAVVALAHQGALYLNARADGEVQKRANRLARWLGPSVIGLFALLDLSSFAARLDFREALAARPWGLIFPLLTIGGLCGAIIWVRRGQAWRAYLSSCVTLIGALATAGVGIYPNILPARDPINSLSIHDAAAAASGLKLALCWWLPGMLLVGFYFAYIHSKMPARFSKENQSEG
jgi:cytochrome bd ubiquinol oxidase subunit II